MAQTDIAHEIEVRQAWIRQELLLQIQAGVMTVDQAIAMTQGEASFWQPRRATALEAWQA